MGNVSRYKIQVDGFTYHVSVEEESGEIREVSKETTAPAAPAAAPRQEAPKPAVKKAEGPRERTPISTLMPGNVTKVLVNVGDEVQEGDTLLMLEAMKMESPIYAVKGGTVDGIEVKTGDNVDAGQVLLYNL